MIHTAEKDDRKRWQYPARQRRKLDSAQLAGHVDVGNKDIEAMAVSDRARGMVTARCLDDVMAQFAQEVCRHREYEPVIIHAKDTQPLLPAALK